MRRSRDLVRLACKRALVAVLLGAPLTALVVHGCNASDEPPLEDYCGWLADEENCYRKFGTDILTAATSGANRCTNLSLVPSENGKLQTGSFQSHETIDKCFMTSGGIVLLDPPLDLNALPLTADITIKMINADETECATVTWADVDRFTLDFKGDTVAADAMLTEEQVAGGVFFFQRKVARKTVSVGCPGGESHYFNLLEANECPEYANVQPRAELNIIPGGLDASGNVPAMQTLDTKYGLVSLSVFYQPTSGDQSGASVTPVEYFRCIIPPPPERCADGVQNGDETDIDCGGVSAVGMDGPCERCEDGSKCVVDSDCLPDESTPDGIVTHECVSSMGIRKCKGIQPAPP